MLVMIQFPRKISVHPAVRSRQAQLYEPSTKYTYEKVVLRNKYAHVCSTRRDNFYVTAVSVNCDFGCEK
jgi:hypothetical protein